VLVGAFGVVVLLVALLGPIAFWATPAHHLRGKELADSVNATRQILLATVGGLAVASGAAFTMRTYYLSERGQLTDRYVKAISLLASAKTTERIGGVYALEHLMIESERDHDTIVEVLTAFVREQTASSAPNGLPGVEHHHEERRGWPTIDASVQASLTVLGRRPQRPERDDLVDLAEVELCGADLTNLNFSGASFWQAKLQRVRMLGTQLEHANLCGAELQDAGLTGANLQHAYLMRANLQKAVLMEAQLQNADFSDADLEGAFLAEAECHGMVIDRAKLHGTDFISYPIGEPAQPVRGLTIEQLLSADTDGTAQLPQDLRKLLPPPNP
jgi:hypothetical protein